MKTFGVLKTNTLLYIIFINLIEQINNSYCGSWLPKDQSSCALYNTNSTFCCYLTSFTNGIYFNMCYEVNFTDYIYLNNAITLGGYQFNIDCGNTMGTTCGTIKTPKSYKDCSQFSLETNSCCYSSYKGDSSCLWLGSPYLGRIEYKGLELFKNQKVRLNPKAR